MISLLNDSGNVFMQLVAMRWWDQAFPILHSKNDLYIQLGICVGHNNELVDRKKRQHFSKWGAPTGPDFRMILCTIPFLATPM